MSEDNRRTGSGNRLDSVLFGAIAVALSGVIWFLGWLPPMERTTGDILLRASTSGNDREVPAVAILIDDAAVERYGPLPWPRRRLAELVASSTASGARGIAIDLILTDSTDPEADQALTDALTDVPVAFAAAFAYALALVLALEFAIAFAFAISTGCACSSADAFAFAFAFAIAFPL